MKKLNAILLIDDDPICNFLTRRMIEKCKITDTIIIAKNGIDALTKLSEFSPYKNICPELILTDMEMPIMDGLEFIESFKEMTFTNKDQVTIIANSTTIFPVYKDRLNLLDINYFLPKPINIDDFQQMVKSIQELKKLTEKKSSEIFLLHSILKSMPRINLNTFKKLSLRNIIMP
jgi:CheY-like chemotaxis protein